MMSSSVHFSSATDNWSTPEWFFRDVEHKYGPFDLDVCADAQNRKCQRFFTSLDDGLSKTWKGRVWMNPPYGRIIGQWVKKAFDSAQGGGAMVVCLLPARTDTAWWHDYCMRGDITFVRGRLHFGGAKNGAPFPSALVVFTPDRRLK
jgi:phage N-6-adenine-methyltransferase